MIEIITGQDVLNMYLHTEEHGIFTPIYEYEHYDQETDSYQGFKVIKTAQEVYDGWVENKNNPPKPEPTLEEKVYNLEKQLSDLEIAQL